MDDGGLSRMDDSADDNYPYMDQFVVDMHTIFVNNVASTIFDRNNSRRWPDTFVVYANCRIDRLDRCLSLQNAKNDKTQIMKTVKFLIHFVSITFGLKSGFTSSHVSSMYSSSSWP